MHSADPRLALVHDWLARDLDLALDRLEPASSDASFRRYFRVSLPDRTLVVMDAPPPHEDVRPYVTVSRLLEGLGVHVPHIHETDAERGLLLLEDLGSIQYLSRLKSGADADALYGDALRVLADIQSRGAAAAEGLPSYDRALLVREMALMPEWFCDRHLRLQLTSAERSLIEATFDLLVAEAQRQPQVFVHRDYHSRNLMVTAERNPGVLDFQDAVRGPIGYDLVSLLKDCYISWPRERIEAWLRKYRSMLIERGAGGSAGAGVSAGSDEREFVRWVDLIGVQRHIKVLGIFARLWYRDGKPGYLADLPLTLEYVRDAARRYPELAEFGRFVETRLVPELPRANARVLAGAEAGLPPASAPA